jgi:phosphoribosyl 1,2-cyclic phosphodiesterase
MSHVEVHSLGSGSSGNSMLIKSDSGSLLIDAGVGIRRLSAALHNRNVPVGQLLGILITHEHADHIRALPAVSHKWSAPAIANASTLQAISQRQELIITQELPVSQEVCVGPFLVRSFKVSHDAAEPVGYLITYGDVRIAYVTDTGCDSLQLRDALSKATLCIVESNHDIQWLRRGPYSAYMKERIASSQGHLSNQQTADILARRLEESGPAVFWLAHLSEVNNSPSLAKRYCTSELNARTSVPFFLDVALRNQPSLFWSPGSVSLQLRMF